MRKNKKHLLQNKDLAMELREKQETIEVKEIGVARTGGKKQVIFLRAQ